MERVAATPSFLLALLVAIAYSADRTVLNGRILTLEAERDSLHSRVDLVERAFTSLLAQTSTAAALPERRLQDTTGPTVSANQTRATVLVDAPDGVSEVIFGGEAAADNVVLHKSHQRDGAQFTLSRNDTQVLRVDPDGAFMVLTETMGKLLASRGVSEEAGTNKSMAGIDVISRFVTCFSSHADFLRSRLGRAHTTTSAQF